MDHVGAVGAGLPPSGEQFEIEAGSIEQSHRGGSHAPDLDAGGVDCWMGPPRRSLRARQRSILAPSARPPRGGRYSFEDVEGRAPLNEPDRATRSTVSCGGFRGATSRTPSSVALSCVLHPQPAYPWRLKLSSNTRRRERPHRVDPPRRTFSETPAPFGIGFHPYLTVGSPTVDDAHLMIPADRRLLADERGLPTGEVDVADSDFDFRARSRSDGSSSTRIHGLIRSEDGRARVEVGIAAAGGV